MTPHWIDVCFGIATGFCFGVAFGAFIQHRKWLRVTGGS